MADPKEMADKLLNKKVKQLHALGDQLVENTLGRYAKESLAAGKPISRDGLRAWIETGLAGVPSAKGKLAPEHDPVRQLLEGALRFLDSAPAEGSDNN